MTKHRKNALIRRQSKLLIRISMCHPNGLHREPANWSSIIWHFVSEKLFFYFRHTSMHGFRFLNKNRPWPEQLYWSIVLVFITGLTIFLLIAECVEFISRPTITLELPEWQSVREITFPAIAICTNNFISKKALRSFAEDIFKLQGNDTKYLGDSVDELYKNLLTIGNLYTLNSDEMDINQINRLHSGLVQVYGGEYPLDQIVANITPKCTEVMKRCVWDGKEMPCQDVFEDRKTYVGNCCLFNYRRPSDAQLRKHFEGHEELRLNRSLSMQSTGLSVVVDHLVEDTAFTYYSYSGSIVYVCDNLDYIDETSGGLIHRIFQPNEEMFISLNYVPVIETAEIRSYSPLTRECIFQDENQLGKIYSLSECLLTCRLNDLYKFCGCLPVLFSMVHKQRYCLLDEMSCLARWRNVWYNFEPIVSEDIVEQKLNPQCPHCLPRCSFARFMADSTKSRIEAQGVAQLPHKRNLLKGLNATGLGIVHVAFQQSSVPQFEHTVMLTWFDLIGLLGGIFNITIGGSIISFIELLYFFSGRFGIDFVSTNTHKSVRRFFRRKSSCIKSDE